MTRLALFRAVHDEARKGAAAMCASCPEGTVVEFREPTRSLEQNARLWAMLAEIAAVVEWPVNGRLCLLQADDWKHILSAGLVSEQRIAQGINGGFVILGQRTSKMSKRELSDLMELVAAFGAERGVTFQDGSCTPA